MGLYDSLLRKAKEMELTHLADIEKCPPGASATDGAPPPLLLRGRNLGAADGATDEEKHLEMILDFAFAPGKWSGVGSSKKH